MAKGCWVEVEGEGDVGKQRLNDRDRRRRHNRVGLLRCVLGLGSEWASAKRRRGGLDRSGACVGLMRTGQVAGGVRTVSVDARVWRYGDGEGRR